MTAEETQPIYVADTHAFYWYLLNSPRLGTGARAAFELAEHGGAQIVIPAIAVAELVFICEKYGVRLDFNAIYDSQKSGAYLFPPLERRQLEKLQELQQVAEMRDRLITAEAVLLDAVVITQDQAIRGTGLVKTIW